MRKIWKLTLYSILYIICIIAFFGIANGLGWEIEPDPRNMWYFIGLYLGGLVPLWTMDKSPRARDVRDMDEVMEERRKAYEEKKAREREEKERKKEQQLSDSH